MRLLVLGGTRFLGRHLVEAALARGDDVTIFTRGRLPVPWGDRVTALAGDRDPQLAPGLDALAAGAWDAVVDCSGYVPRVVEASARLLAATIGSRFLAAAMIECGGSSAKCARACTPASGCHSPFTVAPATLSIATKNRMN